MKYIMKCCILAATFLDSRVPKHTIATFTRDITQYSCDIQKREKSSMLTHHPPTCTRVDANKTSASQPPGSTSLPTKATRTRDPSPCNRCHHLNGPRCSLNEHHTDDARRAQDVAKASYGSQCAGGSLRLATRQALVPILLPGRARRATR